MATSEETVEGGCGTNVGGATVAAASPVRDLRGFGRCYRLPAAPPLTLRVTDGGGLPRPGCGRAAALAVGWACVAALPPAAAVAEPEVGRETPERGRPSAVAAATPRLAVLLPVLPREDEPAPASSPPEPPGPPRTPPLRALPAPLLAVSAPEAASPSRCKSS